MKVYLVFDMIEVTGVLDSVWDSEDKARKRAKSDEVMYPMIQVYKMNSDVLVEFILDPKKPLPKWLRERIR